MKIGIDLDNTIINYQTAFHEFIKKEKEFSTLNFNNKSDLKKKIINKTNGEYLWKKLQGQVYWKYIFTAKIMYGFERFLNICKIRNHEVFIVSHKTEFGHFDKSKIPLRKVAIEFLKKIIFLIKKFLIKKKKNIFFYKKRKKKNKKNKRFKLN